MYTECVTFKLIKCKLSKRTETGRKLDVPEKVKKMRRVPLEEVHHVHQNLLHQSSVYGNSTHKRYQKTSSEICNSEVLFDRVNQSIYL